MTARGGRNGPRPAPAMTPAEPGLREAAQRFLDTVYASRPSLVLETEKHLAIEAEQQEAAKALRAALAAAPQPALDGINVERLARASLRAIRNFLSNNYEGWDDEEALADVRRYIAPAIAAEYERLGGEGGGGG